MDTYNLNVTVSQLQTISDALGEFYDSEKNFLEVQIKDDPNDTETIIHASVNLHNAEAVNDIISDIRKTMDAKR